MTIRKLVTREDILLGFSVLKELRKELSLENFDLIYSKASAMDGYQLIGAFNEEARLIAVMGCRFQYDFVRGKYLFIDDLVTTETMRSQGAGAKLLAFAEALAKTEGCAVARLCAHVDNLAGQRFYDREKWSRRAIVFQKSV